MKEREQLIKELNRYFPEVNASEKAFHSDYGDNQIWFHGEHVARDSMRCDCEGESIGFIDYLHDNGWYIELHDLDTAIAVKV